MITSGVGKAKIKLPDFLFPIERFAYCHDELYCRLILLEDFLFVSLDVTSLQDYAIQHFKDKITQYSSISRDHMFIGVTHTFSAPHTRSQETLKKSSQFVRDKNKIYLDILTDSIVSALKIAQENIQTVQLLSQNLTVDVQVNRDIETPEGYWLGQNTKGFSNKTVPVLLIKSLTGQLMAMIYSVDVQSSLVERIEGVAVSADVMGLVSQKIEQALDCVALFLLGAAADQMPRVAQPSYAALETLTGQVTQDILHQLSVGEPLLNSSIQMKKIAVSVYGQEKPDMKQLAPTKDYIYKVVNQKRQVTVDILLLDELVIVMLKPELASISGKHIQEQSPYAITMVATMINGASKYMVDQASYDKMTYEAMNSMYARGAAEKVVKKVVRVLNERK